MSGKAVKIVVALALLAGVVFLLQRYSVLDGLAWLEDKKEEFGLGANVGLGIAYVLACVFFVPGWFLTAGAGILFGVVGGSITVSISATLGATAAFLVGRYFARDWIAGKVAGNTRFAAVDEAVGQQGFKIVLLTRLSPVFPFNVLNYAYGLTRVSLRDYFLASWIGMIPGTVMYVYIGSLFGNIAALASGSERTKTTGEWVLFGFGLLAALVVTVYVTKVARRALDAATSGEEVPA